MNRETCYYYLTISKFNVFVCLIYVFEFFICSCRRVVRALEQVLHVQLKLHLPNSIYWPPFLDTSNITMGRQACFYIWLKILLLEHMHTYNKVLCKYIEEIQNQHTHISIFDIKFLISYTTSNKLDGEKNVLHANILCRCIHEFALHIWIFYCF